jgi:pimeloyl-ACP methyl ester carboxylesterase
VNSPGQRIATTAVAGGAALGAAWLASRASRARARARAVGATLPESRSLAVESADGTAIHVATFGPDDAPPIVLIHAWMCSIELWHRQIEALAPGARVIALDLRGHGHSGLAPSGDYSIEAFAADLQATLDATLAPGERAVIAGHSLGAMSIAAWAHRHPEEVKRRCSALAMIGTGLGDLISESLVIRAPAQFSSVKELVEGALLRTQAPFTGAPELAIQAGARQIAFGPNARAEDVALVARMVRACDRRVRGECGGTLSRLEVHDGLVHLDVPAAVVAGERDRMTPPSHSRKLAELLPHRPEVLVVPGAGHMLPLEAHEEVTRVLRGLLAASAAQPEDPARVGT